MVEKDWQKNQDYATLGLVMKYFVLSPIGGSLHARASRAAMRAYAYAVRDYMPKLAMELDAWATHEMNTAAALEKERPNDAQGDIVERGGRDGQRSAEPDAGEGGAS